MSDTARQPKLTGADKTEAALDNLFPERCQHVVIDRAQNKAEIEASCQIIYSIARNRCHDDVAEMIINAIEDIRKANQ